MAQFSQTFALSAGSGIPALALQSGFTTLALSDDFLSSSTIDTGGTVTSGFTWYANNTGGINAVVNPTQTAASLNNGNTSGGSNASPNGGILRVQGNSASTPNSSVVLLSVPFSVSKSASSAVGAFKHCYVEFYMQLNKSAGVNPGWPGIWSGPLMGGTLPNRTEMDFMEYDPSASEIANGQFTFGTSLHNWAAGGGGSPLNSQSALVNITSEWHTYGVLWVQDNVKIYLDGNQILDVGVSTSSAFPATESYPTFMILSAGEGAPIYLDWFRVWAPPGTPVAGTLQLFNPPQG